MRSAVNPARAGMIPGLGCDLVSMSGKPRASGDDPNPDVLNAIRNG